jgi:hypothetical protein
VFVEAAVPAGRGTRRRSSGRGCVTAGGQAELERRAAGRRATAWLRDASPGDLGKSTRSTAITSTAGWRRSRTLARCGRLLRPGRRRDSSHRPVRVALGQRPCAHSRWAIDCARAPRHFRYDDFTAATLTCRSGLVARSRPTSAASIGTSTLFASLALGPRSFDDAGRARHWTRDQPRRRRRCRSRHCRRRRASFCGSFSTRCEQRDRGRRGISMW